MLRTAINIFGTRMPSLRAAAGSRPMRFYNKSVEPSSATSGLSFKKHLRQRRFGPVPTVPEPSVEDAVTNILYNTPGPSSAPETRHILNCLVQNEPGVLSRLSGVLAARGFNIESLVVANTEVPDLSRMTVVFNGRNVQIEQARRQLEDLVPVWAVLDYTKTKLVERELLLIKISILGPEHLHEQMPTTRLDDTAEFADENVNPLKNTDVRHRGKTRLYDVVKVEEGRRSHHNSHFLYRNTNIVHLQMLFVKRFLIYVR
ncbi:unnamed protein product [Absidia cylindrospora]